MKVSAGPRAALLGLAVLAALGWAYWQFAIPTHRVEVRSELVMLGDLDGDRRWGPGDLETLEAFLAEPFGADDAIAWRLDLNRNGLLDEEDLGFLRDLIADLNGMYHVLTVKPELLHPGAGA